MYYDEKRESNKADNQVWVTLENGDTYKFDSKEDAAKFLCNIVEYNPYDYAAISGLAEISVELENEAENERYNRNFEMDRYLEARRALSNACVINENAVHAMCYGFILAGGLEIAEKLFEQFSSGMMRDYAGFCIDKAANEKDPQRKALLYREGARADLTAVNRMYDEVDRQIAQKAKDNPDINVKKEANLAIKNSKEAQDACKEAYDAAMEAGSDKLAYKSTANMQRDERKKHKKEIKNKKCEKNNVLNPQEAKAKRKAENEARRKEKEERRKRWEKEHGAAEGKDKQQDAAKKKDAQQKRQKNNDKPSAQSEIKNEYLKKLTSDEIKKAREKAQTEKNKEAAENNGKKVKVKVVTDAAKLRAKMKKQDGLKGIEQARVKNENTFKLRMASASEVSAPDGKRIDKEAENVIHTGGSFQNAAAAVTDKYRTPRMSAGQSGAISRAADNTEQQLKAQENKVKRQATDETKAAETTENRVRITYEMLVKAMNPDAKTVKSNAKMFRSNNSELEPKRQQQNQIA